MAAWLSFFRGARKDAAKPQTANVFVTNSLSGKKELFVPLRPGAVLMYSCGPTVYSQAHIGNLRGAVFSDTLARTLHGAGYRVRRVTNITDVGHLVGGEDDGEDKMSVGAAREHVSPKTIADRYTKRYLDDLAELNVDVSDIIFPRATDYVKEQIAFARTLEEKGFAYRISEGLYFDTARFPGYGKLGNLSGANLMGGARVAVAAGKRNPADFALWRAAKPNDLQQWDSPWGAGNPGWHIECSTMCRVLLGTEIDIHPGGEDLATVHHNDEIAQSEAASGRTFVRYWMHNAFLSMGGDKLSKSLGNEVFLSDIVAKGIDPLALRYFYLQAHYRTPLSFTWDALSAAAGALERLRRSAQEVAEESEKRRMRGEPTERFLAAMRDDLATPQALGILWESLKDDDVAPEEKWDLLAVADEHLGIEALAEPERKELSLGEAPEEVRALAEEREAARRRKDYAAADALRERIAKSGYRVEDGPSGPVLTESRE